MKLPTFWEMYSALIALPSISSLDPMNDQTNKALIDLLANWFDALGFHIDIKPVPNTRNKYNMLARIGHGTGGLLLSGHTDTVPCDEHRWQHDPFKLIEDGGKLYGLGSVDMKGFFVFILNTLRQLDLHLLHKPLYLLATADEETTMAGARYFSESSHLCPDLAIIGEPTSLQPVYAHKGYVSKMIQITGQSGHSSDPFRGINAIELMYDIIGQLMTLKKELKKRYHNPSFAIPYPTLNLANIHGGDAVNRICGYCEMHIDIRPIPELSLVKLDKLLDETFSPIMTSWPERITITALDDAIPAYQYPQNSSLIKTLELLSSKHAIAVNYCTEAPFIQQRCPTIVLGPGSIEQAHQPDEYLSCAFIEPTHQLMSQLIYQFCYN